MTIFIGENDCGKSSILRAIEFFLQRDNKPISPDMFSRINGDVQSVCSIELCFTLDEADIKVVKREHIVEKSINDQRKKTLTITKNYTLNGTDGSVGVKTIIVGQSFVDTKLNRIDSLSAEDLKQLCSQYRINYTRKDEAIANLTKYVNDNFDTLGKNIGPVDVDWKSVVDLLPRFEYYSKTTMGTPLNLVSNTLSLVYRKFFYEKDENGNEKLKEELTVRKRHIEKELDNQIEKELMEKIKATNSKVKLVKGDYKIEFSEGFHLANLQIDIGSGPNPIDSVGEGTKTRLFLAITEWDREVRAKEKLRKVIRGYDEPDTNLHYDAQKEMYYTLEKLAQDKDANIQVLVCTHSVMMIDRASPSSIVHVRHKNGVSVPNWLKGSNEADIRDYLNSISGLSSIRNSSLFFERCFLVVEGDTEEKVLPIVYKTATGRTFALDGIVLNNLKTNSTWDVFLKLLSKNKSEATILFLDKDIQGTKKRIDVGRIRSIGFSDSFAQNNVILAGIKELEDVFSDDMICACLNANWPKLRGEPWQVTEISALRQESKFSDALMRAVTDSSTRITKHDFGERVALMLTKEQIDQMPCLVRFVELAKSIVS